MNKRKLVLAALLLACAAAAVLAFTTANGSARSNRPQAAFKVAWIYVGPHNDHGWSEAHDKGRLYVQKQLGSKVQTTYKQNIALGPQLQQTVASLVREFLLPFLVGAEARRDGGLAVVLREGHGTAAVPEEVERVEECVVANHPHTGRAGGHGDAASLGRRGGARGLGRLDRQGPAFRRPLPRP